jgi:signal transduction histidine kinase
MVSRAKDCGKLSSGLLNRPGITEPFPHRNMSVKTLRLDSVRLCSASMLSRPRSVIWGYGVALATTGIALLVTTHVPPLREHGTFSVFFGAVVLSTWFGGRGPGILVSVAAAFLVNYVVMGRPWTVFLELRAILPMLVFLSIAIMVSSLTDGLAKAEKIARERQQTLEATLSQILEYQQRLRFLASELSLSEERQRREIATGLHDRIGQTLALARIKLGTLKEGLRQPNAIVQADELTLLLKQVIVEVRTLTFELSPPILYEFGLEAGLEWLVESMRKQYNLSCSFEHSGEKLELSKEQFVPIFQATRELLINVVKHAQAKNALVRLENDADKVRVLVKDDGVGFAIDKAIAPSADNHFGLFNIRERIIYLGGAFELHSIPGQGTDVLVSLPMLK